MSEEINQKASEQKEALREKAIEFFKENPKASAVFGTIDGFLFTLKKFAQNHADTLDENDVFGFKNPSDIDVEADEVSNDVNQSLELEKELLSLELVVQNYQAMRSLVKALNIQVTDQKADTIIKALEDYKAKIQA